ncbi:Protein STRICTOSIDINE SYNTHASE-LIKE 10 like [Actinidia chinensis var. chinensis]|uniref:Protein STRICTOSIDINE SYNTHASE-LIKE 10 like n=1 Tax=Actinidia chinensis var. chinensis TaxID=1590841 RepID=A0A2R6QVF7_ACTCC|nr:Protein STRICTOSIDINE SYNTHASE-LIKE 10 like [Actinidia chinensis var. chinensis]
MNPRIILTATALAILSVVLTFNTTHVFTPPPLPGSHDHLHTAEIIHLAGAVGPESLAFDPSGGGPYTGVADGRILKWQGHAHGWVDFAVTSSNRKECVHPFAPEMEHVCGRPLGLRFDQKTGDLYIADAYFGLQVVGPNGGLATQLVTEVEGQPLLFTNDMDIDEHEDVIYFTDSSTIFHRRQFMSSILSSDKSGKLMKYDKSSKEVTVLLRGLSFANGVALSKDRSFVLVAETPTRRIMRLWLHGSNAGNLDVFAELPGVPDNIRRNSRGEFWVAFHCKTGPISNWILSNPWVGKALLKLPLGFKKIHYLMVGGKPHAAAIRLSEKGEVLEVLEDSEGKSLRFVSEVEERNGKLWIGSVMMPFIGIYNLN